MKPYKLEIWKDRKGQWHWHVRAGNGRITQASGSESFTRYRACRTSIFGLVFVDRMPYPLAPRVWKRLATRVTVVGYEVTWS